MRTPPKILCTDDMPKGHTANQCVVHLPWMVCVPVQSLVQVVGVVVPLIHSYILVRLANIFGQVCAISKSSSSIGYIMNSPFR